MLDIEVVAFEHDLLADMTFAWACWFKISLSVILQLESHIIMTSTIFTLARCTVCVCVFVLLMQGPHRQERSLFPNAQQTFKTSFCNHSLYGKGEYSTEFFQQFLPQSWFEHLCTSVDRHNSSPSRPGNLAEMNWATIFAFQVCTQHLEV